MGGHLPSTSSRNLHPIHCFAVNPCGEWFYTVYATDPHHSLHLDCANPRDFFLAICKSAIFLRYCAIALPFWLRVISAKAHKMSESPLPTRGHHWYKYKYFQKLQPN